ncbi:MAG: hypothetical protein J6Q83_00765 [Clostridia bacterium]|nr:hypothetical protein [Clostridia bacterium]
MTLYDAISLFDKEHPNNADFSLKVQWLSQLEHKVYAEMLSPRGAGDFTGYTLETPQNTTLAVPDAFCEVYVYYLKMCLDLHNGEIDRFNNSAVLFNRAYKELFDYINRSKRVVNSSRITAGDLIV